MQFVKVSVFCYFLLLLCIALSCVRQPVVENRTQETDDRDGTPTDVQQKINKLMGSFVHEILEEFFGFVFANYSKSVYDTVNDAAQKCALIQEENLLVEYFFSPRPDSSLIDKTSLDRMDTSEFKIDEADTIIFSFHFLSPSDTYASRYYEKHISPFPPTQVLCISKTAMPSISKPCVLLEIYGIKKSKEWEELLDEDFPKDVVKNSYLFLLFTFDPSTGEFVRRVIVLEEITLVTFADFRRLCQKQCLFFIADTLGLTCKQFQCLLRGV